MTTTGAQVRGAIHYLRQAPAALVVGVGCGLSLLGLSLVAELLSDLVWNDLSAAVGVNPTVWWWVVAVLTTSGLAVGLVVRFAPGHAGPDPSTIHLVSSPLPARALPGLVLALVLTLASGASLGPENPILLINASLVVLLGTRALPSVGAPAWMGLSMAGTLGAMFGTPVAAALMLSEAQVGDPAVPLWNRLFGPLLSAASGSVTMLLLSDLDLRLELPGYAGFHVGDLAWAVLIALGTCGLGIVASYLLSPLHRALHRLGGPVVTLTVGGLVLGLLGAIGGPETLFKGLDQMKNVSQGIESYTTADLALFTAVKLVALVVAAAAGFRGGRIFPALFVGVTAGFLVSNVFESVPPALAVSAGALGIMIAATRNGWLSLFMALALVPDADLLPVLVVAALPAWLLVLGRPELTVSVPEPAPLVEPR